MDPQLVAQYGLAGVVLLWLMMRVERKLDAIALGQDQVVGALNQLSRAITLDVATRPNLSAVVREKVDSLLDELPDERRRVTRPAPAT